MVTEIGFMKGVQYAVKRGDYYRVVFEPDAPMSQVQKVDDKIDAEGRIGATQKHSPCIDYNRSEVEELQR